MLPAGPQAMRTGAEQPEARVVMLHQQGGLFRIIVQNLHEKASGRSGTRGAGILTLASVGKEFLSGDVPPSPSPVSLRPDPGDHRRRGRPDRDAPHPHLLVAIAPPNGSRQLTDAEAGLYNAMRVRQAHAYIVHRPALRASLPGAPERLPTLTCLLLRSCVHHCPPIRLTRQEIGQVPAQARRSPQRRQRRRRSDHRRRSPIMEV
jgi:hypothetical protein